MKLALEAAGTGYSDKSHKIFLQGSYGNDTNVIKESDVDVVIRLDSIFTYDLSALPPDQQQAFRSSHGSATYTHEHFRNDVLAALRARFGAHVQPGSKAVVIEPFHNRRKADVLIATQHSKYNWYVSDLAGEHDYVLGISFHKADGTRVINYPRHHRENLVTKNQQTNEWFKHIVRIFKNAREQMIVRGHIEAGVAPSYYLEGLLYNVPTNCFGDTYVDSMVKSINWLHAADRSQFICANQQYLLLDGNREVTWNGNDCTAFMQGIVDLWDGW
ncbi:nucleotidyltransferase domain-containing protein [Cupriavidus taiwanensis]|uniref:nucleotidyltransferase domain-containing protein n=1 Tax=Cupriavidus taiwanensis TaxID=164546 RepID=UPI000E2FF093|nr:nucleotidyltransferase [Cupriavidus taiwanensis]